MSDLHVEETPLTRPRLVALINLAGFRNATIVMSPAMYEDVLLMAASYNRLGHTPEGHELVAGPPVRVDYDLTGYAWRLEEAA